ncbi:MAG: SAM-dependent methyltransferase [Anaerolineales bacterium]|nr:class I SAM-dependent methyltransferase [Anaerolineae bacterium]PWB71806.1 MAG: SAM-dependent methyltransferase [Anaerolineales bacterium]
MPNRKTNNGQLPASFRDPSGFLFSQGGTLYRQVNRAYEQEYARLMDSGLYEKLVKAGLLIPHVEVEQEPAESEAALRVIQPERVPFISHPYEWSFGQLKDAALATLAIQKRALKQDMSLKDASAYNIQFVRGKATLIDTLSFELYKEGEPWVAYRQFCQHFLAPLALMALTDVRLNQLLRVYIDGVPLDLASELLPSKTRFNFGLLTHIHLHAGAQRRYSGEEVKSRRGSMSRQAMIGLIDSLIASVQKLDWTPRGTEWGNYYDITNYSDAAFEHKKELVRAWTERIQPALVWDLGANNGIFSRVAGESGLYVVSFDIDPAAVEQNYRQAKKDKTGNLLPLLLDLTNPSPAIGWANRERESFGGRGPADLVLALAVIHHLAISNNVPLPQLAEFFAGTGRWLVIEFVPKSDSQVKKLLASRKDIFPTYVREGFETAFKRNFKIHEAVEVRESERVLYLMERV